MRIKATSSGKSIDLFTGCRTFTLTAETPEDAAVLAIFAAAACRGGTIGAKPPGHRGVTYRFPKPEARGDAPKRHPCPDCKGDGGFGDGFPGSWSTCRTCAGAGVVPT